MCATHAIAASSSKDHRGLAYWMVRAVKEAERVRADFSPENVHDLRVALRRCRSMADALGELDVDSCWSKLKKSSRKLFRSLGELRDAQVMAEWIRKLAPEDDPIRRRMLELLSAEIEQGKAGAVDALENFDEKAWQRLARVLPERARKIPREGAVFQLLALERWNEARELHHRASRTRSRVAWHRVRISLKRFRYIVENFLPRRHAEWGADLKRLQDLLGEVHDLDVLRAALLRRRMLRDPAERQRWLARIEAERRLRLGEFHKRTRGPHSLWEMWRSALPEGRRLEEAALLKVTTWASFRDPDFAHSKRVAALALELFDGFQGAQLSEVFRQPRQREILHAAALLHDVGRVEKERGHHKLSHRMISLLRPPLGWTPEAIERVALVARYHRGAEPRATHKEYAAFSPPEQDELRWLAATLRLADALDAGHDGRITHVRVENAREALILRAQGYTNELSDAVYLAEKKHLLETLCRRPVVVRSEERAETAWRAAAAS